MNFQTFDINGTRVRVGTTSWLDGSVPLLIFNGLGIRADLTADFAEALHAQGVGVVTIDAPGIGGSSEWLVPYRLSQVAQLAARALDALGIGKVDVFGVSWGGTLAQEFARRYGFRTRRLVLCATFPGLLGIIGNFASLARLARPKRVFTHASKARFAKTAGEVFGGAFRTDPTLIDTFADYLRPIKGIGFFQQMSSLVGWSSVPWLRTLKMPTLVLMGTDDPIAPQANGRIYTTLMPNAHVRLIDDGHMFFLTRRDELAGIIAEFLKDPKVARATLSPTG